MDGYKLHRKDSRLLHYTSAGSRRASAEASKKKTPSQNAEKLHKMSSSLAPECNEVKE